MSNADTPSWPTRRLLLIPFGLYVTLGLLYTVSIPSGEAPDEPGHLQCVEQVSRLGRVPQVDPPPSGEWWSRETVLSGRMCYHMPLFYIVAGATQWTVHQLSSEPLHFQFPPTNPEWGDSPALFAHDTQDQWGRVNEPATVLAVRLLSLAAGGVVIWATYVIAGHLFPQIEMAGVAAATLVAGWPQFLFMSRAISNDILALALAVTVLAVLVAGIGRPRRFVIAALLSALAILTRLNMLFVLAPLGVAFALELARAAERRRAYLKWGALAATILLAAATVITLHPTLREHARLTSTYFGNTPPEATQPGYWLDVTGLTLRSGWALFGWMNVFTPEWQSVVWWAFLLTGSLLGLRRLRASSAHARWHKALGLAIILVWFAACTTAFVRINLNRFQPQFRFLFSLVPLLATFAAAGYMGLLADKDRVRIAAIVSIAFLLLLANVAILVFTVVPAYS